MCCVLVQIRDIGRFRCLKPEMCIFQQWPTLHLPLEVQSGRSPLSARRYNQNVGIGSAIWGEQQKMAMASFRQTY